MKLSSLKVGDKVKIISILSSAEIKNHLEELGFVKGVEVEVLLTAPLGEPTLYKINNEVLALRINETSCIEVEKIEEQKCCDKYNTCLYKSFCNKCKKKEQQIEGNITVALIGNPNCGKTTLFNALTCSNERVGNYAGVTVDIVEGNLYFKNYKIKIVDLPGINSLNTFQEEEKVTRDYIFKNKREVIAVNVIDVTHLKKNLLLTTQLLDLNMNMICVLNMFDKCQSRGQEFNVQNLSESLKVKCIPTIAEKEYGLNELLNQIIVNYEEKKKQPRLEIEDSNILTRDNNGKISTIPGGNILTRDNNDKISTIPDGNILTRDKNNISGIKGDDKGNIEYIKSKGPEERYKYIDTVLGQASYMPNNDNTNRTVTKTLDRFLLDKKLSFLFFLLPIVMFQMTFSFGGRLSEYLSDVLNKVTIFLTSFIATGIIKDIIVNGFLPGIETVIVFVPQLFILYFSLFILEDSGCMNRLVFIIDRIMQKIGLSGQSFIPLSISFGCNVPGVLATKAIHNRRNKIITCLLVPMISCPAKIPIYVLLTSLFFSDTAQMLIISSLYIFGILVAIICSKILHFFMDDTSKETFIIEFPEYKMPNVFKAAEHSLVNIKHFIKRIGIIISFASIILWGLEYFPQRNRDNISESYIANIGRKLEPALKHNGFNWQINVSLIGGIIAKEIIAPILMILYKKDVKDSKNKIKENMMKGGITIPSLLSLLIFILLFTPCVGTLIAIKKEIGIKWMFISLFLNTMLAYLLSFFVFNIATFFYVK